MHKLKTMTKIAFSMRTVTTVTLSTPGTRISTMRFITTQSV